METTISVLGLRRQLGQILDKVAQNQNRLLVTKRGEIQAVIMSPEDYFARIAPKDEVLLDLQKDVSVNNKKIYSDIEIEKEIASVREELEKYK